MTKVKGFLAVLAATGVLVATEGCVSRSTHNKVLAELSQTQGDLTASRNDNSRLRTGLDGLARECGATVLRIKSADAAVGKLKENEQRAADCLAELRQIVDSQTRFLMALEKTIDPLENELNGLRDRASALAGPPAAAPGTRLTAAHLPR